MKELRKFQSSTFGTIARRKLIEDQNTLLESRSLDLNKQAGPLWRRPWDQEAIKALAILQKSGRQVQGYQNPISDRKRQHNKLDLSFQEYLEWLSIHWAEQFVERREPSNHFQAGHQSQQSGVISFSWDQKWQKWHSHVRKDNKWVDQWERTTKTHSLPNRSWKQQALASSSTFVKVIVGVLISRSVLYHFSNDFIRSSAQLLK